MGEEQPQGTTAESPAARGDGACEPDASRTGLDVPLAEPLAPLPSATLAPCVAGHLRRFQSTLSQSPWIGDAMREAPRHETPCWEPSTGHYGNNIWLRYSPRLDRIVRLYSDLEHDHWILLEADATVDTFCEQPVRVRVVCDGQVIESVIDTWVRWRDGREQYREVKYLKDLREGKRSQRQVRAQRAWCARQGTEHAVLTEREIRAEPNWLGNWRHMLGYLTPNRTKDIDRLTPQVLAYLQHHSSPLGDLEQRISPRDPGATRAAVFALVRRGTVTMDLRSHLVTRTSEVSLPYA